MSKENNTKKSEIVDYKNLVFVIDNLDKKQLEEHDKHPYTMANCESQLAILIEDGFKISLRWDDYSGGYLVSAVCMDKRYQNAGLAISARSDGIEDCMSILFWKYFNIAQRDLRGFADKKPKGIRG